MTSIAGEKDGLNIEFKRTGEVKKITNTRYYPYEIILERGKEGILITSFRRLDEGCERDPGAAIKHDAIRQAAKIFADYRERVAKKQLQARLL